MHLPSWGSSALEMIIEEEESTSMPISKMEKLPQPEVPFRDRRREITVPGEKSQSHPDLSLGLTADLGQMKGNRRSVFKRSGVQENNFI